MAYCNLGVILRHLGKLQEAELSQRKAIELKPHFAKANKALGLLLLEKNEFELSLIYFCYVLWIIYYGPFYCDILYYIVFDYIILYYRVLYSVMHCVFCIKYILASILLCYIVLCYDMI